MRRLLLLALLLSFAPRVEGGISADVSQSLAAGGVYANLVVGTTAVEVRVGAAKAVGRHVVTVMPFDAPMFWGYDASVTVATGTPIFQSQLVSFPASDKTTIYLVCASAAKNARITESP